jgi:hypothetical protein
MKRLLLAAVVAVGVGSTADAAIVWGVQPATGQILQINPANGAVLGSFAAPAGLLPGHTQIGLDLSQGRTALVYFNSQVGTNLQRLNPSTGALLSTHFGDSFGPDGLATASQGGTTFIYTSHDLSDMHRQTGFGGGQQFFWGPGAPVGGVGGDDNGRVFSLYTDGLIHEINPFVNAGFLSGFAPPAAGIQGLAFDGTNLYAYSTVTDRLYTLNPNTGAVLNSVLVSGGDLFGLAASPQDVAIPEPATLAVFGALAVGAVGLRRRRRA